jgi:hypothetical protein
MAAAYSTLDTKLEAVYPLTLFDNMTAGIVIAMGWLVEGSVDLGRLEGAVNSVVADWKLLAGRLEKDKVVHFTLFRIKCPLIINVDDSNFQGMYQIRVPLGEYSAGYKRYTLTSQTSKKPLSHYVALPLGLAHDPLPSTLFKNPDTPRTVNGWTEDASAPLLNWHVTHFPGRDGGEASYSCIGLTFPHAAFDGMGIASVVHAVEAELLGNKWSIPAALKPGPNKNTLANSLENAIQQRAEAVDNAKYTAVGIIGFWWILCYSAWTYWQSVWHHSQDRILIVPAEAVQRLVENTRHELAETKGDDMVRLSKGDVIASFLFKVRRYLSPSFVA